MVAEWKNRGQVSEIISNLLLPTHIVLYVFSICRILKYHKRTVEEIAQKLVGYSYPSKMAFLGMRRGNRASLTGLMDHLSCFYPGLLALGIYHGLYPEQQALAANLTHTCYNMYKVTTTGLAAESIGFNTDPNRSKDTITKFGVGKSEDMTLCEITSMNSLLC